MSGPILTDADHCLICGKGPAKRHWFAMLWYLIHDWICEACWGLESCEWRSKAEWATEETEADKPSREDFEAHHQVQG